jgi:protein-S-isoprenylcysteine O-methyltransferase Ste14
VPVAADIAIGGIEGRDRRLSQNQSSGTSMHSGFGDFSARGGWWVLAQLPLLVAAYLVPPWTGAASSDLLAGAGLLLVAAGALQAAAAALTLGRALTPFPRPLEQGTLRTRGLYALVRHPIYSGILLMAVGWSLHHHSPAGLAFDLLLFVFFDRKAAREERWLMERYPDYAAYRTRVRKLIPYLY